MKRISLLVLLSLLFYLPIYSQIEQAKPDWAINPIHIEGDKSTLVTISEYGRSKETAQIRAFKKLEEEGRKLNEGYRIIEEYWEYTSDWAYGYFLVQISNELKCTNWEYVEMRTTKYPFSGRVFVPGMAQIHKGTKAKGGIIIGAEALGVAGIVTSFSMKATNEKLMYQDPKHMAAYDSRANMWQNIGYGCIAFTAAVYIYNIIDGIVAPGKKHIQIGKNSYDMAVAPVVTTCGDFGLAMQVKF